MVRLIFSILLYFNITACGKQNFPDYHDRAFAREVLAEAYFSARFHSLNSKIIPAVSAEGVLWFRGDQFYTRLVLRRGKKGIRYQQHIHRGPHCPDMQSDRNGDGLIDLWETFAASGKILIPLDQVLNQQLKGMSQFPISNRRGEYSYSQAGSIHEMLTDLRLPDPFPNDGIGKLGHNESLELEQRTIILYETSSEAIVPIACANILKVTN